MNTNSIDVDGKELLYPAIEALELYLTALYERRRSAQKGE